jgi:hypothetical protein
MTQTAEPMILRPGQASVRSFLTVHSSEPNTSSHRRIGIAIRYVAAQFQKAGSVKETATLVSGNGFGLFQKEMAPVVAMGPDEKRAHALALEREKTNYLKDSKAEYS